ncbi:hypothetical protein C8F04DRAFT_1130965 [Mycena alexandri]|uniref:Secreted protein n=1 Tax=Mycena alexandri TaxID=1745969 RepID=A0AAD6SBV6_9AGAR|nr:hypothetical protein C8F04DRAFT_1130965 [Mycena alexandri]
MLWDWALHFLFVLLCISIAPDALADFNWSPGRRRLCEIGSEEPPSWFAEGSPVTSIGCWTTSPVSSICSCFANVPPLQDLFSFRRVAGYGPPASA